MDINSKASNSGENNLIPLVQKTAFLTNKSSVFSNESCPMIKRIKEMVFIESIKSDDVKNKKSEESKNMEHSLSKKIFSQGELSQSYITNCEHELKNSNLISQYEETNSQLISKTTSREQCNSSNISDYTKNAVKELNSELNKKVHI